MNALMTSLCIDDLLFTSESHLIISTESSEEDELDEEAREVDGEFEGSGT